MELYVLIVYARVDTWYANLCAVPARSIDECGVCSHRSSTYCSCQKNLRYVLVTEWDYTAIRLMICNIFYVSPKLCISKKRKSTFQIQWCARIAQILGIIKMKMLMFVVLYGKNIEDLLLLLILFVHWVQNDIPLFTSWRICYVMRKHPKIELKSFKEDISDYNTPAQQ